MNVYDHDRGDISESLKNWRTAKKVREAHSNLSRRIALENCGFELACTISRCLLRPSACSMERVEGSAIEIAGGPRGDCIQAHIETHPRDVSELSANRTSAFHRRHHLPRCDVHSKKKGGCKGSVTGLSWRTEGVRRRRRWRQRKVQDDKDEGYAIF